MSATSLPQMQAAVFTRLRATAAFISACALYDAVPEKPVYPYGVYDEPFETPDRTFGQGGHDVLFSIVLYSRDGSTTKAGVGASGWKTLDQLAELVIGALVDPCDGTEFTPITVDGHDLVDLEVESNDGQRGQDGISREHTIQFRALLEDAL